MGKIKKILENELVGGIQTTDVYPVTSTKAVYDENNERLDNIINKLDNTINKIEPGIIYDVSANNDDAVFESLQALLSSSSLNTLIPTSVRCGGMSIRFIQSSDNRYVQYRLAAPNWSTDIHDWTSEDPYFVDKIMQKVNEAIDEHTPIEIRGDVTNAPDEEDLTSVNVGGTDVLKFKDKAYIPLTYSGMGRKILRKNIVYGVNALTQSMVNQANTIYVIQYDFTLGEDITIPDNCVLEFDGGSIIGNGTSKDTIIGNNTIIVGNKNTFSNVTFTGIFDNNQVFVSWFVENTDKSLVNAVTLGKIIILDKDIAFTQNVSLTKSDITIKSNHYTITEGLFSLSFNSVSNVIIEGINFYGTDTNQDNTNNAIAFNGTSNCAIKDCVLDGCYSHGFIFQNSTKCSIDSCEFKQTNAVVRNMLSYGKSCDYLTISNNKFKNIGLVYPIRIDLCTNSYIINNSFVNVDNNPILVNTGCSYCTVSGNYIDTNQDSGILISNDPVYISDGQGGETVTRETAHHITITKNHVRNSKDTGIGLYNYQSSINGFIHHVTIEDNICEDNGLNSGTSNFRSQIFVSARNFIITGNILRCAQKQSDVSGVFIQNTYAMGQADIIENGEDIKIFNNLCENVVPFGQNHNSTGGGSINIKTDIGISRELDLNFYVKSDDSNFPKSEIGKFTWADIAGGYPTYSSIDADNKVLSIHTSTPTNIAAMRCTFEDNSLFVNPCLLIITGLIKISNQDCGACQLLVRTTSETRVREEFDNTDYIPFYYSVLCHKDVPKIEIGAPKYLNEGTAYYKDVKFELRYL